MNEPPYVQNLSSHVATIQAGGVTMFENKQCKAKVLTFTMDKVVKH